MNDLHGVPLLQKNILKSIPGNDISVKLDNDSAGSNPQLFEELRNAQRCLDLSLFAVDLDYHALKNRIRLDHIQWPGNTVLSSSRRETTRNRDSHASLRRHYPGQVQRVTR
jgi:hypothetical protein